MDSRTRLRLSLIGYFIVFLGMAVLSGWILDEPILKSIVPGFPSMKFNNSICFILLGISFVLLQKEADIYKISRFTVIPVLLLASVSLLQDMAGFNAGIDEFFIKDETARMTGKVAPGRMATTSSFNFILLSVSFLLIRSKSKIILRTVQNLLQIVIGISFIAMLGYLYNIPAFYKLSFLTSMALPTSIIFLMLATAACFMNPSVGILSLFLGNRIGNLMAKKLFPIMMLMIIALGFLGQKVYQQNLITVDFVIALLAVSFSLVGLFLISRTARNLNAVDKDRTAAEKEVIELNRSLENTIAKRTNELRQSLEQFREAFEHSAIGMALVSLEGKWLKVNPQVPKMLGYSKEELLQKTFQDITHPDDLATDLDLVKQVLEDKINTYQMEKRYLHKNGSIVWVLLNVSLLRDELGEPIHFISQIENISKRKQAEEEAKDLNLKMSAIFDSGSQVSIIGTDTSGIITYFSKGSETLLGYKASEVIGRHTPAIIHSEEEIKKRGKELSEMFGKRVEGFDVFVEYAKQGKFESREWTYIRKDKTSFPVQLVVTAIRKEGSEITGFLGIATDISERKKSEEKFKSLLESAPDAMVIVDQRGKIVIVNSQTISLFGFSREELEGQSVEMLIPQRFKLMHVGHRKGYFSNPLIRPMGEGRELLGIKKNGQEFSIEISLSPIETTEGKLVSAAIRDVTERIAAQKHLEEMAEDLTNRNRQLANFAHITSHNLRAPVSNLNSLLAIYNTVENEEDKKEIFEKFETVIHHLSATLNELVEALKIKENLDTERSELVFEKILKKTTEIMTAQIQESKATIEFDFSVPTILYNKGYLESIFQNLVGNAIKYRSPDRRPLIQIKSFIENDETVLTIADNGLGINLERHGNKIFGLHKTFHRHAEAKGVGLFITKTQVEAMGGKIIVESEVDKGSKFTIRFGNNND